MAMACLACQCLSLICILLSHFSIVTETRGPIQISGAQLMPWLSTL
uniref:Uncharacterized protein n=1 Tax=Arundo donax TaxID=35708 RepID=A0A0A9CAD0_ARUDO